MDKLNVKQIKEIFKNMGIKGYTTLKKAQLIEKSNNEEIYDRYLLKIKKENQKKDKLVDLEFENKNNLQDFYDTVNDNIDYNEDESDTEDSVTEEDFETNIEDEMLCYGDYPEIESELYNYETDQEKKDYLISLDLEDITEYDYKFGNSIQFSQNRSHGRYFIGKNDELIFNPMFGDGDLVYPYEITKYTKNALRFFDLEFADSIYLRYDDEFVKKHIQGKIYYKWKWEIVYNIHECCFDITDKNNKRGSFEKGTQVKNILYYFKKCNDEKIKFNVNLEYNQSIDIKDYYPHLPVSWSLEDSREERNDINCTKNLYFKGPKEEEIPMKILIEKSFERNNITYNIS